MPEHDEKTGRKIISKSELKHGSYYVGRCRNACVARWNGERHLFYHWREKFGHIFLEPIHHPADETVYDIFRVYRELFDPKFEIPLDPERIVEFKGNKEDLSEFNHESHTKKNLESDS